MQYINKYGAYSTRGKFNVVVWDKSVVKWDYLYEWDREISEIVPFSVPLGVLKVML